ncbi:MAG: radical SAM protein [Chloroflexota bacterium]
MRILGAVGRSQIASVYMAEMTGGGLVEFVEALQPPYSRDERWILMVSTLFGCPVRCRMCDAGGEYRGKPTTQDVLDQIDYLIDRWYPDRCVPAAKFKIQFARMGEPTLNAAVLDVLETLPARYAAPGLIPSISTIAPVGAEAFLDRLLDIKDRLYAAGRFQFQFSIHTTDVAMRDWLIPVRKWDFAAMSRYGERFHRSGDRKITLNFALAADMPVDPEVLSRYFDPQHYLIKITPVNPTYQAQRHGLVSHIVTHESAEGDEIVARLSERGYEVIVSIGELEENRIGSNCGQYVLNYLKSESAVDGGYSYPVRESAPVGSLS